VNGLGNAAQSFSDGRLRQPRVSGDAIKVITDHVGYAASATFESPIVEHAIQPQHFPARKFICHGQFPSEGGFGVTVCTAIHSMRSWIL
jgi:hypothetical protein